MRSSVPSKIDRIVAATIRLTWRTRLAYLSLLLAAFLGHATMPPAVWGSLATRESEHESDTVEEVWKWTARSESRGHLHGRRKQHAGAVWGPPRDWMQLDQSRRILIAADAQTVRGEWALWNGLGGPLRC